MTEEYHPPFILERKELGCWISIDCFDDLESALCHASMLCNHIDGRPENQLQIVDKHNRII